MKVLRPSATSVRISVNWRSSPLTFLAWSKETPRDSIEPGQRETRGCELLTFANASRSRSPTSPSGRRASSSTRTASPASRNSATRPALTAVAAKWQALMIGEGLDNGSADVKKISGVRVGDGSVGMVFMALAFIAFDLETELQMEKS